MMSAGSDVRQWQQVTLRQEVTSFPPLFSPALSFPPSHPTGVSRKWRQTTTTVTDVDVSFCLSSTADVSADNYGELRLWFTYTSCNSKPTAYYVIHCHSIVIVENTIVREHQTYRSIRHGQPLVFDSFRQRQYEAHQRQDNAKNIDHLYQDSPYNTLMAWTAAYLHMHSHVCVISSIHAQAHVCSVDVDNLN